MKPQVKPLKANEDWKAGDLLLHSSGRGAVTFLGVVDDNLFRGIETRKGVWEYREDWLIGSFNKLGLEVKPLEFVLVGRGKYREEIWETRNFAGIPIIQEYEFTGPREIYTRLLDTYRTTGLTGLTFEEARSAANKHHEEYIKSQLI